MGSPESHKHSPSKSHHTPGRFRKARSYLPFASDTLPWLISASDSRFKRHEWKSGIGSLAAYFYGSLKKRECLPITLRFIRTAAEHLKQSYLPTDIARSPSLTRTRHPPW